MAKAAEETELELSNAEANRVLAEAGITERYYNTAGAAWFFGKKDQWVYYNQRLQKFRHPSQKNEDGVAVLDDEGRPILET